MEEYHKKLLAVIKKYDPQEYEDLVNNPIGGVTQDHLDYLQSKFPKIEEFEKFMAETYADKE